MRGIPHMVATMNCQSTSNACRRGKAQNSSKWPANNHVSGLTLSRQCVHTLRCAEKNGTTDNNNNTSRNDRYSILSVVSLYSSVSGSVHLLVNMAPTQRRVLLKERGK